jgi:hypothetical protein
MSDDAANPKASFEGLALLEALRPPDGYVTDFALGATYSVELPVALAALVALSGTVRDTSEYGLHSAVRALDALNERVRIAAQQGRIGAPPASQRRLAHLLDRVIRPVVFDEAERSFHPKTWLVRYARESGQGPGRWCLVVGSRNLTSALDWDLAVNLEGEEDGEGAELPALTEYARWVLTACGEPSFGAAAWKRLPSVRWRAPGRAAEVEFGFHGPARQSWSETALAALAGRSIVRLVLVSPFLDVEAVQQAARLFESVPRHRRGEDGRRLVAGRVDLEEVSRSQTGRAALEALGDLRFLAASPDGGALPVTGDDADDMEPLPSDLGLHAKVVAAWHAANDVTLLLGSANLTRRGWTGVNGEAWVRLRGGRELGDPILAWSRYTMSFDAKEVTPPSPEEAERTAWEHALNRWSHAIARLPMVLDDDAGALDADAPIPPPPGDRPMVLAAARFGTDTFVPWPVGAPSIAVGRCAAAERTRFVVLRIRATVEAAALERTWVQAVTVRPDIDAQRDRAAFAEVLGPSAFLALLDGILDAARADLDGEAGDTRDGVGASFKAQPPGHDLSLERILRAFARRDGRGLADLRAQMSRMVAMYREGGSGRDDARLRALWEAWDAIERAFGEAGGGA